VKVGAALGDDAAQILGKTRDLGVKV